MSKTRWLLWTVTVLLTIGVTAASVVLPSQPEGTDVFAAPFIYDLTESSLSYCEVHRIAMYVAKVPVTYGLPVADEAIPTERFPHRRAVAQGGCAVMAATHAWVYVCPECQRVEDEWKRTRYSGR